MLAFIGSLIHNPIFHTSRQKILLRRRKRQSKRLKAAKKQLKQHDPKLSLAHELKILQIQKQLDRKVNLNSHLNELMDDLFYPDVRYANEQQLSKNVLKMTATLPKKQQLLISSHQNNYAAQNQDTKNEQKEQIQQVDQLIQQIYLCQLPSEMFELFNNNFEYFGLNHTITLLNRLRSYFKNRQKIKQKLMKKWTQSVQKMKQMSEEKTKIKKRCPYIFLDIDDLIRDEAWILMIKRLSQMLLSTETKKNQLNQKQTQTSSFEFGQKKEEVNANNQQIQYLNSVKESYNQVFGICELLLTLKKTAGYIPANIYQIFINKIIKLSQKKHHQRNKRQTIAFLHSQMTKILLVLTHKNNVKSHYTAHINIQNPGQSKLIQQKVLSLGKQLIKHILTSQKCTAQDLGAVIRTSKGVYKFINDQGLQLAKSKIIKFLPQTNLQRSIDYLHCYWRNGTQKDMEFINILKYDIYRKLPSSFSKIHLFNLLKMIKYGQINFKQSKATLQIVQIYEKVIETITSYMQKYSLKNQEIQQLLKSLYQNYPVCEKNLIFVSNKMSILEIICGQIIKIGDGFSLEDLSDLLFRANVLGYKSKVFAKYVFDRYKKQYKKQIKKYRQQKIQLLPSQNATDISNQLPSLKEIELNQYLIMMFWSVITTIKQQKLLDVSSSPVVDFNQMLQMWILKVKTDDSLIWELISNINRLVKQEKLFPQIKILSNLFHMPFKESQNSFKIISSLPVLPTLKTKQYHLQSKIFNMTQNISKSQISNQQVRLLTSIFMNIEALCSQCFFGNFSLKHRKFLQNYTTYYLTNNKKISDVVEKDYVLQTQYLNWLIQSQKVIQGKNFFNDQIQVQDKQFLQKRKQFMNKVKKYYNTVQEEEKKKQTNKRQFSSATRKYQFI